MSGELMGFIIGNWLVRDACLPCATETITMPRRWIIPNTAMERIRKHAAIWRKLSQL